MLNMLTRGTLALILFLITTMYNRYICRPISIGNKQQNILDKNIFLFLVIHLMTTQAVHYHP